MFIKGHIPWNKGKKGVQIAWNRGLTMSEEAKRNMSIAQLGNKNKLGTSCTEESKRKMSIVHMGSMQSEKTKKKMSEARTGNKNYNYGKHWTIEMKNKMSEARKGKWIGKNNPCWKGGISSLTNTIRHSFKYRQWRSDVYTRDDFTCQKCGQVGKRLNAHHFKSFSSILQYYEITTLEEALNCAEMWNINNGITLCKKCHKIIHKR